MLCVAIAPVHAQTGFDRPGGDYFNFNVSSGDPAACAARCEREGRCRAWSFSYPRTATPAATCWLKNRVTARVEDSCCVSGVKGAGVLERKSGPIEFSIDRTGGDLRNMDVNADPTGTVCGQACEAEPSRRSWSSRSRRRSLAQIRDGVSARGLGGLAPDRRSTRIPNRGAWPLTRP